MIAAIRTPFCALLLIVGAGCNGLGGASSTAVATQARPASSVETRAAEDTHKGRWPSPTLAPAEGWMTSTASSGGLATAEATTVPLHDPVGTFPGATLARLPANGIVILAWGYRPKSPPPPLPLPASLPLPYHLPQFRHDKGWEGQPAANVPLYVLFTSLRHHLLSVYVFFGTQHPGADQMRRAQTELNTLSWG